MEDNILNALTSFTASFLAEELKDCRLTGEWLSKLQQNKNEIKIIWQDFFEHVKSNEQSCHNLYENLNTYLINGELDFACDRSFDYNSFEGFSKCLLLNIDNQVYQEDNNGIKFWKILNKTAKNGKQYIDKEALELENILLEFRTRASYLQDPTLAKSLDKIWQLLDQTRHQRNKYASHTKGNMPYTPGLKGETFEQFLKGFFALELIYRNIADTWAGLSVKILNNNVILTVSKGQDSYVIKNLKYNQIVNIPIKRSWFNNEYSTQVKVCINVAGFQPADWDASAQRGMFSSSPYSKLRANRQGTQDKSDGTELKKENAELKKINDNLNSLITELEKKNAELEKKLLQQSDTRNNAATIINGKPKGYIIVQSLNDEDVCAFYEGKNTYGCLFSDVDKDTHQKINITSSVLQEVHFCIMAENDKIVFFDLVGDIRTTNDEIISSNGKRVNTGTIFKIGSDTTIKIFIPISL